MSIPGVAQIIAQVFLNLIYFDIMFTEEWLPSFLAKMGMPQDPNDKAISVYFDDNGFQSKLLINNLGSTLIYLAIYIVAWVLLSILEVFSFKLYESLSSINTFL